MSQFSVDHCERANVSILPAAVEDLTVVLKGQCNGL